MSRRAMHSLVVIVGLGVLCWLVVGFIVYAITSSIAHSYGVTP